MFPPAPALKALRLARLADITRIGIVAAAGFYHSTWFPYDRAYADQFPFDTLASYRHMYRQAIVDPNIVVLVAEDTLNKTEVDSVYHALAEVYPPWKDQIPEESLKDGKAIVGITSLIFNGGSDRCGQFQPDGSHIEFPKDPDLLNRDKNPMAGKLFLNATHAAEERVYHGRMVVDTIVVHPAYWRRGHATNLSQWQLDIADQDNIGLGVACSAMGTALFKHLGFSEAEVVQVPGYKDHPKPLDVWLGYRNPANEKFEL